MAEQWGSIAGGSGGQANILNAPAPKNILEAFNVKCAAASDTKNVGLLSAVGYTNLVNVEAFVTSPEVTHGIAEGRR